MGAQHQGANNLFHKLGQIGQFRDVRERTDSNANFKEVGLEGETRVDMVKARDTVLGTSRSNATTVHRIFIG
jgi:hypothetical protein